MTGTDIGAALSEHPEDELVRVQLEEARKKKRAGWKRWAMIGLSVAIIALTFAFVLPKIADYRAVWDVVKGLSWQWIVVLILVALLNAATNAPPWMAALPGLSFIQAARVTLASTAMTMVAPGGAAPGMATSFAMLKKWGYEGRPVGLAVAVTSIWNQLLIFGIPILAVAGLVAQGNRNSTVELVALIALAAFCVIVAGFAIGLSSARLARRVGDWAARIVTRLKGLLRRAPVTWNGEGFVRFRGEAIVLLRARWWYLTLATLANHLSVFLLLVVCLRAVGVEASHVTIVEAFAAWALSRVLSSIAITPGGLGFVELGLTGALVRFGATNTEAVTATLVYRFLSFAPTLVLGLLAAATFRVSSPSKNVDSEAAA
ncbi:MAG: lysylphosphatidylglycerol synthase transmembrane domain-containing protein [Gaiellaceae bacterium]